MSLYVFRNTERRPSRDSGEVAEYLTRLDGRGRELPVAISSRHRGSLLWRALAGTGGAPEPRPRGLKVIRMRPSSRPARWLRLTTRRLARR